MRQMEKHHLDIRRKVLVVDDELINRRILGNIVSSEYDVLYAENGAEALSFVRDSKNDISLILLDLQMPVLDGFSVLSNLQDDPILRRIPVIVLTSDKSAEVKCLSLGAVDFIAKPYDLPEVIIARIKRSIELAEDTVIINETETDDHTGLYAKAFFLHYAKQHDHFFPDMPMDALSVNVSRFHVINELFGRAYGDKVLTAVADIIKAIIAEYGNNGIACRSESDKFELYVPHRESYDALVEECADTLAETLGNSRIVFHVGVYSNVDISLPIEQRFDRAAIACNNLRSVRHTACGTYDTATHERELMTEKLVMEIDRAIEERQFIVYYQPKYNIRGNKPRLGSAEALVRWIHPELGMISPGLFIPAFEEHGLISKLDRYVWERAAEQIHSWKTRYGRGIPVSVNVSRVDLFDPELKGEIQEILRDNELRSDDFLLEITESAYTDNQNHIIETVSDLHDSGLRIEMDDFGTGYSSLNMLASLPIDALKLDMKFVRNICTSDKDYRLVKMIIDVAKMLNVPVIAEGVETKDQYLLLKQAGCDIIQGYYFSKPLPAEEFEKLITEDINDND